MSEIKWIKLTTSMFDDEKIDYIESLPDGDTILVIWIKLLTLAGKCNAGGFILLTESIPYTDEMLSHKLRRPQNTVKLAMTTFERLGMIDRINGALFITNWEKHQNTEKMKQIREQTRLRVKKHRERQQLPQSNADVTQNVTDDVTGDVTQSNATDIDIDIDHIYAQNDAQKNEYTEEFLEFWQAYPKKKEKKRAFRCWKTRLKEGCKPEGLITAAKNYATQCKKEKTEPKFIKHPSTFLGPDTPFEEYLKAPEDQDATAAALEYYGKMR